LPPWKSKVDTASAPSPGKAFPRSMSSTASSDISKMSTAAKTSKASAKTAAAPKVEPVAAAPVASAAAPAKASKTSKAKAVEASAPVVAAPVPAPSVAAPAPSTDAAAATETVADDLTSTLNKAVSRLSEINSQQKTLAVEAAGLTKSIEKLTARLAKKAEKRSRKGTGNGGKAFKTPVPITAELQAFLGLEKGVTSLSRREVNAGLYAYVKSHGLMKGKNIYPDAALRKLLNVTESTEVTILNFLKFINHHYIKPAPVAQ
jgi:chromatin remodeling complex protein RSC6